MLGALGALRRLEREKLVYDEGSAARKGALLALLARRPLPRAGDVRRLHEVLCFLRAYPDDAALLGRVETMLARFAGRSDLRRHRVRLTDSGIAGTDIRFRFFQPTASWLARRWPSRLVIDWDAFRRRAALVRWLPLLTHPAEVPGLDEYDLDAREWMEILRGPRETDAAFLVRRFDALRVNPLLREFLYDELDPPLLLAAGPKTPSRTSARYAASPVVFQDRPLAAARPALLDELRRPPVAVRQCPPREARALIDLAREAMITRSRDLDVFCWGDPRDVRLVDAGNGLQFACIGAVPERRLLLESVYGFLTLKNGVPIGYVLCSALFGSSEIAYNVFETYRGAEAAAVYGRVLAMVRHLFGSDSFAIDPYQIGHHNEEAIRSGAWWFYQKLGFRPNDPGAGRLMRRELARMSRRPRSRSSAATLRRLAGSGLYLHMGRPRTDVMGIVSVADVGLRASGYLARRFGADREAGARVCARDAAGRVGLRGLAGFSSAERRAWERWAPLVMLIPGLERWSAASRRALVAVVRAKGGARESDFVRLFDAHRPLRRAVLRLACPTD